MEKEKKEWIIVGVIALILITVYAVLMSFQVTYWKHQNIAYEQYKTEDCRQARLFNATFANSEEELSKKIENFTEEDKIIVKALYEVKPNAKEIKQQLKEDKSNREQLIKELSGRHNILADTKETIGYMSIQDYITKYNINYTISKDEYVHLRDLFVPKSYITSNDKKLHEDFFTARIDYYEDNENTENYRNYSEIEKELSIVNENINKNENQLKEYLTKYNELIKKNSPVLEYQDTIKTNGIKTASDYMFAV